MAVFGLQWTQATDARVRPAESVLTHLAVTSPTNAETLAAVAQASTYAPWSGMRRCNLWDDGTPTAYYGDRCYTDTDVANMGQAMVRIPKFWYTTNHGGGVYIWYISTDGNAADLPAGADHAWAVHPAFIRNGVTKDYIYVGAYEGYFNATDSKLESKAGVQPTSTKSLAQFRTAAELRIGTTNKWEVQDYLSLCAVQLLYLVEYGHFNAQLVLSAGITNMTDDAVHNQSSSSGHTTALGNASGSVLHTFDHVPDAGDVTGYAMSYRGIENLYGNGYKVTEGINVKANYDPWIADHDFATNYEGYGHPYINDTATPITGVGFITDIKVDATYDYVFLASAVAGGSATTKLCDYATGGAGNLIMLNSGSCFGGAAAGYAGPFYYNLVASTSATRNMHARLMYIG